MKMEPIIGILIFIFGTIIGSFLNVCIYRLPLGLSLARKPSSCPACGRRLGAFDLVPVLSYVWLGGKCRGCKQKISAAYPLIEALTGILFLLLYLRFGLSPVLPVYAALISLLIVIAVIDMRHMEIPNGLVIAGLTVGFIQLAITAATGLFDPWHSYVIGFFVGALPLLLIALLGALLFKKEAMGGGDIKMMAFCGLITGWRLVIPAYFIGIFTGAILSIILIAAKQKKRGDAIPFGPFLALGVTVSVFFGNELINWYLGLIG